MSTASHLTQPAESLAQFYRQGQTSEDDGQTVQVLVSQHFLKHLAAPLLEQMRLQDATPQRPVQLLDLAGGSGVVIQEAHKLLSEDTRAASRFVASDNSEALVELMKKRIGSEGWVKTETKVIDAMVCCVIALWMS